ncbi:G-type lectin S-receptor-like serine threonine-kinase At4g27290 isoform X2 [Olea europaea subsp. europaea]|uniref:non-specific serine/threonine protein kinase n=1 Tax=Olea europaea subsp. europaea TaxID=158383 RepID=A0A8S0TR58_OLEEU|nr:G-type lectin S-receptor-like serine threonine-kinase At4g27290 isoform X2 [Olea europaea subsp. europaea]
MVFEYITTCENCSCKIAGLGNLVVKDANDDDPVNFLWESFNYPTDTLLPGMKLGWNFTTELEVYLSSWKSKEDPSSGDFTYHCDPTGYPQNILKKGSDEQYKTGPWNGLRFSGAPNLRENNIFKFELVLKKMRFLPKDPEAWKKSDWSNGCVRRNPLNCQTDVYLKYSGIKLPDTRYSWHNETLTLKECKIECLNNCTCTAYTYLDISRGGSGCLIWFGDLIDIKELSAEGQDIYIRMSSSESGGLGHNFTGNHHGESHNKDIGLPLFDVHTITKATDNFSINNQLGEGGFGPVYKGRLEEGQEVAVKRLSRTSLQGFDEFKNEVICIAKLQHQNLVKLLGCYIQGEEKMLIYEFLTNRSLDLILFDPMKSAVLDWPKRFHIINGVAKGLMYLHQDSCLRIIHRDLKASNILLDSDMNPKISDFGLARSFGGNETGANTSRVVGTYGYMSPEYATDRVFSQMYLGQSLELVQAYRGVSGDLSVLRLIHVGLLCVQQCPEDRPNISSIVLMLGNEGVLPNAKKPGFFTERDLLTAESSTNTNVTCSMNEMTITLLDGR